jgi:hypothetical protein
LQGFAGICKELQRFARICKDFVRICKDLHGFTSICKDLQGFARIARIRKDLRGFASICKDLRGCTRICKELPGFAIICRDLRRVHTGVYRFCAGFYLIRKNTGAYPFFSSYGRFQKQPRVGESPLKQNAPCANSPAPCANTRVGGGTRPGPFATVVSVLHRFAHCLYKVV